MFFELLPLYWISFLIEFFLVLSLLFSLSAVDGVCSGFDRGQVMACGRWMEHVVGCFGRSVGEREEKEREEREIWFSLTFLVFLSSTISNF